MALRFLSHSNPDVSYKKINAIKEQSLRLLLFLLSKGEVASILGGLTVLLEQSSDLDASLIRYFVASVVDITILPVSMVFARSFGALLMTPKCVDAIRSTYFAEDKKSGLARLLKSFPDIVFVEGKTMDSRDSQMLRSLLYCYEIDYPRSS